MDLHLRHVTEYRYSAPVSFGDHRLMLRPRDSFDIRILSATLTTSPPATLNWMHDAYGNPIATATFDWMSDRLVIESELVLRRYGSSLPRALRGRAASDQNRYTDNERIVLSPYIQPAGAEEPERLIEWALAAMTSGSEGAHPLAKLSSAIRAQFGYSVRFEEGTQSPAETLRLGTGSCRDLAWLFIETTRRLGYAARFVSGYLHDQSGPGGGVQAPASFSHAWAEVFIPGDGWIEFDPTNALMADPQLIRVGVARTPGEVSPVSGSFFGDGVPCGMNVAVHIQPSTIDHGADRFFEPTVSPVPTQIAL